MPIRKNTQFIVLLFAIGLYIISPSLVVAAEESIVLTTYYPSPYGVYGEMRLYPKASSQAPACDATQEGLMFYDNDSSAHTLKVCRCINAPTCVTSSDFGWVAATNYWTLTGTNLYPNSNTWNVGIGTAGPKQKLDISGNVAASKAVFGASGEFVGSEIMRVRGKQILIDSASNAGQMLLSHDNALGNYYELNFAIDSIPQSTYIRGYGGDGKIIINGNVGIGTASPGYKLDVSGGIRVQNLTIAQNLDPGFDSVYFTNKNGWLYIRSVQNPNFAALQLGGGVTGTEFPAAIVSNNGNLWLGVDQDLNKVISLVGPVEIPDVLMTGGKTLTIGNDVYFSDIDIANTISLRGNQNPDRATLELGSGGARISGSGGNVGIGTTVPASALHVASGCITGAFCSDARMKEEIEPLREPVLDRINQLHASTYKWKYSNGAQRRIGMIAQEVEKVFPEIVAEGEGGAQKGLDCTGLNALTIEAIKEQQAQIETLKARIDALEKK